MSIYIIIQFVDVPLISHLCLNKLAKNEHGENKKPYLVLRESFEHFSIHMMVLK